MDTTFKRCFVHVSMKLNAENSTIASLIYFTIGNIRLKFLTKFLTKFSNGEKLFCLFIESGYFFVKFREAKIN